MTGRRITTTLCLVLAICLAGEGAPEDAPVRQVLIEATIVEVANDDLLELGFEWGKRRLDPSAVAQATGLVDSAIQSAESAIGMIQTDPTLSGSESWQTALGHLQNSLAMDEELSILLRALESTYPKGKMLAKPAVFARNSAVAAITSGLGRADRFREGKKGAKQAGQLVDALGDLRTIAEIMGAPSPLAGLLETFRGGPGKSALGSLGVVIDGDARAKVRKGALEFSGSGKEPQNGFVNFGTKLVVTPQVAPDGHTVLMDIQAAARKDKQWAHMDGASITIELHSDAGSPSQEYAYVCITYTADGADQIQVGTSGGGYQAMPITATRDAITAILTQEGQNIVLGGLILKDDDTLESHTTSLPVLGMLPYLRVGTWGSTKKSKLRSRELLLFLTPHIVRDEE